MPNVFITNSCNLNCPYCFAKGMLGTARAEELSLREVKDIAAFVRRSDGPPGGAAPAVLSLLGGEPTLHSDFTGIMDYLLARKFVVKLFSNGTFPRDRAAYLAKLPEDKVNIILNINRRETYTPAQYARVRDNLKLLHRHISLGLTIDRPGFDYETVLGYVERYDLKRDIRLGISMPIVKASNTFMAFRDYKPAAARILRFAAAAFERNVRLGFDCGFILCMFTRRELGRLQLANVRLNFICDGAIDIGKGGRVWRCFPLHGIHNTDYRRFNSVTALRDHYNGLLPAKTRGISGACGRCPHYTRHNCSGGCYSYELR